MDEATVEMGDPGTLLAVGSAVNSSEKRVKVDRGWATVLDGAGDHWGAESVLLLAAAGGAGDHCSTDAEPLHEQIKHVQKKEH